MAHYILSARKWDCRCLRHTSSGTNSDFQHVASVLLNSAGKQAITRQPATLLCFLRSWQGSGVEKNKTKPGKSQHYSCCSLNRNPESRKALACSDLSCPAELSMIQLPASSLGSELWGRKGALQWGCNASREAEVSWTWKLFPVGEKRETKKTLLCQPYHQMSLRDTTPVPIT